MTYNQETVKTGDFVKIDGEDKYLTVTSTQKETLGVRGDWIAWEDLPYSEILDLKLESEFFEAAGRL